MKMFKVSKRGALLAMALAVSGCASDDVSDLDGFITEVRARPAKPIEPMPTVKTYEAYLYVGEDLRDPFMKVEAAQLLDETGVVEGPGPDLNRVKEDLEAYPLDTLRMVGTLSKNDQLWGLVKANDGVIHLVQSGHYLGQNFGRIIRVEEQQIELGEWVSTSKGRWREREASLALVE